jgi:hypothetical protein
MALTFAGKNSKGEGGEEAGFIPICKDAFKDLDETTKDYEISLDEMADAAGIDFGEIKTGTDQAAEDFSELIQKNDELLSTMGL